MTLAESPLNVGGFPRPLMSTRPRRSFCRGFALEIAVRIARPHCYHNLRQSVLVSHPFFAVGFQQSTSRSVGSKQVVVLATYASFAQVLQL